MQKLKLQVSHTTVRPANEAEYTFKSYQAEFNELGQVLVEENFGPDGQSIETHAYTYNEEGFLVEEKKNPEAGQCMHYVYEYDEFGRMISKVRQREKKVMMRTTFTLHDDRETELTTGPSGLMITKIDRIFDEDGKLTELIEYQENEHPLYVQKFSYDLDGNLTMAEYFDEKNELMELHIRDFDEEGRVVRFEKQNNEGHILDQEHYQYNELGLLVQLQKLDTRIVYAYNELGLEERVEEYDTNNQLLRSTDYEYDPWGMVSTEQLMDTTLGRHTRTEHQYEFFAVEEPSVH